MCAGRLSPGSARRVGSQRVRQVRHGGRHLRRHALPRLLSSDQRIQPRLPILAVAAVVQGVRHFAGRAQGQATLRREGEQDQTRRQS